MYFVSLRPASYFLLRTFRGTNLADSNETLLFRLLKYLLYLAMIFSAAAIKIEQISWTE